MEAQADAISSFFSWSIANFSKLPGEKLISETFEAGGCKWQVSIYPKGESSVAGEKLSIFLNVADSDNQPVGWSRQAEVLWSVVDQVSSKDTFRKAMTDNCFNAISTSWGYSSFMPISQLHDSSKGFLLNDTLIVDVWVTVGKDFILTCALESKWKLQVLGLLVCIHLFSTSSFSLFLTAQATTPSSTFTWAIQNFSKLSARILSTDFAIGDYRWYMNVDNSPSGSRDNVNYLKFFLHVADRDNLPRGWSRYVHYGFSVVDQVHTRNTISKGVKHKYGADTGGNGYASFMPTSELHATGKGFLVNDTLIVRAWALLVQEETTSSIFTWTVTKFSTLRKSVSSPTFLAGTYKWQLSLYPKGKGGNHDTLSLYLSIVSSNELPRGWSTYAECDFSVVDQVCDQYTVRKELQYKFSKKALSIGYQSFVALCDLKDHVKGFLLNDTLVVKVGVSAGKVVEYHAHDSKIETGYVGLIDHGENSYINSALQSLYHIPYFRKIIYKMPETEDDMSSRNISLQLQRLFYELQYSDYSVAPKDLTDSVGWSTNESLKQHDVQDLSNILYGAIEDKAKGTLMEGSIQEIFEGHRMSCIECINVKHTTKVKEPFHDLQLDVKGCPDVYASFDKYVGIERLDGNNKYLTEEHGLQDAKKSVRFVDFPPVLQLQLKRFERDFVSEARVKIYDRYAFPLELDLDRENGKYLSPDGDWRIRNLYTLHSVLVHNGGEHGGRYHVLIRPTLSDQWFSFNDERITKVQENSALEEQYGGEEPEMDLGPGETPIRLTKLTNAYMLVYIRKTDMRKIMCGVDENDITEHLLLRLRKEQEEKEHKKKEGRMYTIIKIAQDEDLIKQIGTEIYCDLVDHEKVHFFRVNNWMRFCTFKEEVASQFGIPVQFQRFWLWEKRQNHSYRPSRPLTPEEEIQTVGQLRELSKEAYSADLKLFLEVELGPDLHPIPLSGKSNDHILLFFKLYDAKNKLLSYVGNMVVKISGCPSENLIKLNKIANFSPSQEIELYKEVKYEPVVVCEQIDTTLTFKASELKDGDIVCYQKSSVVGEQYDYPNVPSFLTYQLNWQVIHFRSLQKPKDDEFSLRLWKLSVYDEVMETVAHTLGLHKSRIRLTAHDYFSHQPKANPIDCKDVDHLSDMLVDSNQTSGILYYEMLNTPQVVPPKVVQPSAPSRPSCVVCFDAQTEGICVPCGHMSCCMSCLNEIHTNNMRCPVCRGEIERVVRVYSA